MTLRLRRAGQHADDHLVVDGVGDAHGVVARDEAQVADVGEVVVEVVAGHVVAGDERLEDAAHAGLVEPREQGVEVRRARQDEPLLGRVDVLGGDGLGRRDLHLVDDLARERVDEPGLARRQLEGARERVLGEGLPRVRGVLPVERAHVVEREVAEAAATSP